MGWRSEHMITNIKGNIQLLLIFATIQKEYPHLSHDGKCEVFGKLIFNILMQEGEEE